MGQYKENKIHLFRESVIYVATFLVNEMNVVKIQVKMARVCVPIDIFLEPRPIFGD